MGVKTQFSIKDLENLSNVKAHTIRIWEKRYRLLTPDRTETNIRQYDLLQLKKLLNIAFLYKEGYKISKIAKLSEEEIVQLVTSLSNKNNENAAITILKSAMFDFNYTRFSDTYKLLKEQSSFREIFINVFLPLLSDIGMLWQTETIDPSHEHFISELIKQKVILNIEIEQKTNPINTSRTFCLYLPYGEIHEIGLLYANYELLSAGFKTIYLGRNIPIESLRFVLKHHKDITFLSYFTVTPNRENVYQYIAEFRENIMDSDTELWLMGQKTQGIAAEKTGPGIVFIQDMKHLFATIETLKES